MPTHTFIADSANEAVTRIRSELGPSAVVLSVRKLPRNGFSRLVKKEQIEVVASVEEKVAASGFSLDVRDESNVSFARTLASRFQADERSNTAVAELKDEIRALKQEIAAIRQVRPVEPARELVRAPAWNAVFKRSQRSEPPRRRDGTPSEEISAILKESGILPEITKQLLDEVPRELRSERFPHLDCVQNILRSKWRGESMQGEAAVHIFVGVPGSGKSTVLCKMLAQTTIVEQQPATVYQLDSHVANSGGQTAIFAEIIGAQFERTVPQDFERREESVFVDLPGVALGDEKGLTVLRSIIECFGVPEVHLVLNGAYEAGHLLEQVEFFANVGISDLVVTHLDEEQRWGKIWNLVLGTNYGVRYLSCGQNVPGDLLPASAETVLERQFRGN